VNKTSCSEAVDRECILVHLCRVVTMCIGYFLRLYKRVTGILVECLLSSFMSEGSEVQILKWRFPILNKFMSNLHVLQTNGQNSTLIRPTRFSSVSFTISYSQFVLQSICTICDLESIVKARSS
jgi:hypothetical protein